MGRRDEHDHHVMTRQLLRTRGLTGVGLAVSSAMLVLLYVWDFLTLRLQWDNAWCRQHYEYPSTFDYLLPGTAERIGAGITEWWNWFPPGLTCTFTDSVTRQSVTVGPAAWRGYAAAVLVALVVVLAVTYVLLRRRRLDQL